MAKQILRLESIHTSQGFVAKMRHNYRLGNIKNADPEKSGSNKVIIELPAGLTYNSFFEHKLRELSYYRDHKIRKNAIRGYEILMSYGMKNRPEHFSLLHWAELSKDWLISEFGRANIASAILHMDEGVPHIHAVAIPIKDGKLNASAFFPDRQSMRDLHIRYHMYTKQAGLEAENQYMIIDHTKTGMFYKNIDRALEQELPQVEEGETLEAYINRANEFFKEQMLRVFGKEHQIEQLKKENTALENANQTARRLLDERINSILGEIGSVERAKRAIEFHDGIENALAMAKIQDEAYAVQFVDTLRQLKKVYGKEEHEICE